MSTRLNNMKNELKTNFNIFDYINWRGDLSFDNDKINIIDLVIISQLALLNLDEVVIEAISIKSAAKEYFKENKKYNLGLIIPSKIILMFKKIKNTNRFKNIILSDYINDIDEDEDCQISALTCKISDDLYVISFSGTDDTLVGWKENFDLIYKEETKAQREAINYVSRIINKYENANFYIIGHSKGGNLAYYSYIFNTKEIRCRVKKVFNFDGPGLTKSESEKAIFIEDVKNVISILPESSCIGNLFKHVEKIDIVKSNNKGLYQHDVFSWLINVKDFYYLDKLSDDAIKLSKRIDFVLNEMSEEERYNFSNNIYNIFKNAKIKTLLEASENKKKIFDEYFKLSREERKSILNPIKLLLKDKAAQKIMFDTLRVTKGEIKKETKTQKEL